MDMFNKTALYALAMGVLLSCSAGASSISDKLKRATQTARGANVVVTPAVPAAQPRAVAPVVPRAPAAAPIQNPAPMPAVVSVAPRTHQAPAVMEAHVGLNNVIPGLITLNDPLFNNAKIRVFKTDYIQRSFLYSNFVEKQLELWAVIPKGLMHPALPQKTNGPIGKIIIPQAHINQLCTLMRQLDPHADLKNIRKVSLPLLLLYLNTPQGIQIANQNPRNTDAFVAYSNNRAYLQQTNSAVDGEMAAKYEFSDCSICLIEFKQEELQESSVLPCGHILHPGCFKKHTNTLDKNGQAHNCPICRNPI